MGKQLKDIEKGDYSAGLFIKNMKRMVDQLVYEVRSEKSVAKISYTNNKTAAPKKKSASKSKGIVGQYCPKCKSGQLVKGKSAYGCHLYGKSCDFVLPFSFENKKISENQYKRLLDKGSTVNLKGFIINDEKVEGLLRFNDDFQLKLEPKKTAKNNSDKTTTKDNTLACPRCKNGNIIKGKTAYGCSDHKQGCDFRFSYDAIREKANGQALTKELVFKILNS